MNPKFKLITLLCVIIASCARVNANTAESAELIDLNEDNWQSMLQGEWMVEFFAPWCPACKSLSPTWRRFATSASLLNVKVAQIDVTTSPSLSGRFFVTALPTIYHVKEGVFRQYRGSRDSDAFLIFLKQKQWQKIDPIPSWKQPDSYQMSVLSYFFKLSHVLKELNTKLYEEYGIPTWGSCALLTMATIFVGATLGLLLICVVDVVYPPKKSQRQSFSQARDLNTAVEDIPKDEIVDDVADEDEEDEEDNDDDEEDENTSDGEKNSHSESDSNDAAEGDEKNEGNQKTEDKTDAKSTEVRKRRPRKAD